MNFGVDDWDRKQIGWEMEVAGGTGRAGGDRTFEVRVGFFPVLSCKRGWWSAGTGGDREGSELLRTSSCERKVGKTG